MPRNTRLVFEGRSACQRRVFVTTEGDRISEMAVGADRQRRPSMNYRPPTGIAGAGRDALPPGLAGGAGRGSDGAVPVVVGALDLLSLACSVQLHPPKSENSYGGGERRQPGPRRS